MITATDYGINQLTLASTIASIPSIDFKLSLNEPTGNFFYNPWTVKSDFKNTCWGHILDTLPGPVGEARLIKLDPGVAYQGHADIDDRWHLTIVGKECYLIDLSTDTMHTTDVRGRWYYMDAGRVHSACNFGPVPRIQLVVRKLLERGSIQHPVNISITPKPNDRFSHRYEFDHVISPWLNHMNKQHKLDNFNHSGDTVSFTIEQDDLPVLKKLVCSEFNLTHTA